MRPTVFNAALIRANLGWPRRRLAKNKLVGRRNPMKWAARTEKIIAKFQKDSTLTAEMTALYPDGWSAENITNAIGEYEKALITPNSRFDKWLKGDAKALSVDEQRGYERFKAYRCASCHVGKSMGGQSFEYMDRKKIILPTAASLGSDKGLFGFTKDKNDMHKFKVPTLRNVELTAPYLHDGTVTSLDEAVRIMGVYLAGFDIPQQDRTLIVNYLRTLTGEFEGKPLTGQVVAK